MTGVEILSSETIYNSILPEWIGVLLMIVSLCLVLFALLVADTSEKVVILLVIVSVAFFGTASLGFIDDKNDIDHIEYRVLIDESVSMTEFFDKYEVIDKDGRIYTIRER